MTMESSYSPMYALSSQFYNKCYYCGDMASSEDFVPPLKYVGVFERHYAVEYKMLVPSCLECKHFLSSCYSITLGSRMEYVKKKLEIKYKKAIRIYRSWDEESMQDISQGLRVSIKAGISLGREAYDRIRFSGYSYEYSGQRSYSPQSALERYEVDGRVFDKLRDALLFVSRSYLVNIHTLEKYFIEEGGDVALALARHFREVEMANRERNLKMLCKEFSDKNRQGHAFVEKTVRLYLQRYPDEGVEWCLNKIYVERILNRRT